MLRTRLAGGAVGAGSVGAAVGCGSDVGGGSACVGAGANSVAACGAGEFATGAGVAVCGARAEQPARISTANAAAVSADGKRGRVMGSLRNLPVCAFGAVSWPTCCNLRATMNGYLINGHFMLQ
ncbi:MAG: hypothetical protein Kow00123_07400 [Anaerolineales bacterium]